MASPTTLGGVGMAAIGSFPVGGSTDALKPGVFLFLDGEDLAAANRFQATTLEMTDLVGGIDHLQFLYQVLAGGVHLSPGQRVIFRQETVNLFQGRISSYGEARSSGSAALFSRVEALDLTALVDRRLVTAQEIYTGLTAGAIVRDLVTKYLTNEGITTNSVVNGPTLATFTVEAFTSLGDAIRGLSDRSAFIFFVDALGDVHFEAQTQASAPFDVGASAPKEIPLIQVTVTKSLDRYRNRQTVRYGADLALSVTRNDTAEQASRAAVEGGSGIYHASEDVTEITTAGEATDLADALLRRFGKVPQSVRFSTRRAGLRAGQSVVLDFPEHGISNATYFIDEVTIRDEGRDLLRWDVTALSGEHLTDPMQFWRSALRA